ncbi:MAG: GGDEF domain-containing protein [Lachnospiraceae bacterium]|nr:GGDEF domain-containing protein [Lachnospiraceae bacterium]
MKKGVERFYYIFLMGVLVWFLYLMVSYRLDVVKQTTDFGYHLVNNYTVDTYKDSNSPTGIRQEYTFQIQDVDENYNFLLFYTYHENVKIYLDNERIYKMEPARQSALGKSPGCIWNSVFFQQEDNGKILRIVITPVYNSAVGWVPQFYFGNRYDVLMKIVVADVPDIFLSVVAIFIGALYIMFGSINYRNSDAGNGLVKLGCFSVLIGVWKLTDAEVFGFLSIRYPAISQVTYMALMLIGIPFVLYIKDLFNEKYHKIWDGICIENLVQIAVVIFLQIFRIADLRQTLFLTHIAIVVIISLAVMLSVVQGHTEGWNSKLKNNLLGMFICFLGAASDILWYYISPDSEVTVLAMFCFVVYIIVLGFSSLKDAKNLMAIGMRALHYEEVAYHDQLTGLYNRTAYAEAIASGEYNEEKCIVMMFDLNDLKKCNDVLGHDQGDIYIRESARIIQKCFGDLGNCYRTGGDEFCALMRNCSLAVCRERIKLMHTKVEAFNATDTQIHMQIACGCEVYDRRIDYDIGDTLRRADKAMYREKYAMKHGETR